MDHLRRFFCLSLLAAVSASAQVTLYWDTDGATPGLGNAPGSWNASHWTLSASGDMATVGWVDGNIARFDVFGGSVLSLDANVTAGGIYVAPSGGLTLSGTGVLTLTPGAVLHNASSLVLGVTIAGTAAPGTTAFTFDSFYPIYLNGTNTYTGQTIVQEGNLYLQNAQSLGASGVGNETIFTSGSGQFLFFQSDMTLNEGFTFTTYRYLSTPSDSVVDLAGPIVLQGGGSKGLWSGTNLTISGVISESGGAGTFAAYATLTGANTFTGALEVGRVTVSSFNNAGVAGPLGAGTSVQLGYDYEGPVNGEIVYTGATATSNRDIILFGNGAINVANPATTLTLTGFIQNSPSDYALGDPGLEKKGPGTLILPGANDYTGLTYLTNGSLILGHNWSLGPNDAALVDVGTEGTGLADDLSLWLQPGVYLAKEIQVWDANYGGGTTTLGLTGAGLATFAGEVYLRRQVEIAVPTGGQLNFSGFFNDGATGGSAYKTGGGRVVFTGGIDLRGGGLEVQAGSVQITGSVTLADDLIVRSGATLLSDATLHHASTGSTAIAVDGGGILSPGLVIGTTTTPGLSLADGAMVAWQLAGLSTSNVAQFDRVVVDTTATDALQFTGTPIVTVDLSLLGLALQPLDANPVLNDVFWQSVQVWQIIDFSGTGTNALLPGTLHPFLVENAVWAGGSFDTFVGGGSGDFAPHDAGDLYLRFTPVPEPSTWALLGVGVAALGWRCRRRRVGA